MNPLEIYKLLPKTNCGECASKTCMSFAVALGANPVCLEQCIHLAPEKRDIIRSLLVKGDWRDELLGSLMGEVSKVNLHEIAPHLGCSMRGDELVVGCIGREYTIGRDGTISPDTGNKWIGILLLHYVRNRGTGDSSGKWVSFSEPKGGFVKVASFQRECEEPLRQLLDEDPRGFSKALKQLNASEVTGFSADHAWSLDLLPKVRALILYRCGDEEFPSSLKMLFDSVTAGFIDVETLIFLCEGLVHTVAHMRQS